MEYLRDVRNKAEHPERRFVFIEGEDLLMIKEPFRLTDEAKAPGPPTQAKTSNPN